MTTLNTLIEEEKEDTEKEINRILNELVDNPNYYQGRAIEEIQNLRTTAMQRAWEVRFVDGMIAATEWLIDNGHLKAGKDLNELMLKALGGKSEKANTCFCKDKGVIELLDDAVAKERERAREEIEYLKQYCKEKDAEIAEIRGLSITPESKVYWRMRQKQDREEIWLQANKLPIHDGRADLISLDDLQNVLVYSELDQDKQ